MGDGQCELVVDNHCQLRHRLDLSGAEDLFSVIGTWEERTDDGGAGDGGGGGSSAPAMRAYRQISCSAGAVAATRLTGKSRRRTGEEEEEKGSGGSAPGPAHKKHNKAGSAVTDDDEGAPKISHVAVERNRRKQMNEHLTVLRSLMPCFYVKRGDQASIIGGVVDYIKELQQVLRSLEAKKHRKAYAEQVLSPRPSAGGVSTSVSAASPRHLAVKSVAPLSPRMAVPISPRTPTPGSPYKAAASGVAGCCRLPLLPPYMLSSSAAAAAASYSHDQQQHYSTQTTTYLPTLDSLVTELATQQAACRPAAAAAGLALPDVKVEFAGPNLVLKTVSHRAPGQALKIIAALESLSLQILHVSVSAVDDTMLHSFTIKIGIECELSAEELVQEIQQTLL
ncbi:Transcription factor SPEECHLESS [Zea mays]|uniref:BHLH transcription factor n=1 Tax=Zea mays TaxID=4577 RepID=C0HGX9_MAIZE|eukprot:NP_001167846.1 putative HLH DNA-binding domain superfamily protein [Zea mays]